MKMQDTDLFLATWDKCGASQGRAALSRVGAIDRQRQSIGKARRVGERPLGTAQFPQFSRPIVFTRVGVPDPEIERVPSRARSQFQILHDCPKKVSVFLLLSFSCRLDHRSMLPGRRCQAEADV
jgi:hypothetical protein